MFRQAITLRWRSPLIVIALCYVTSLGCGGSGTPAGPSAAPSQAAQGHLEQMVTYMQERSLRRLSIDWTDFRARVFAQAGAAQTILELYPAIQLALSLLDDGHSFYRAADGSVVVPAGRPTCEAPAASTPSTTAGIGYVRVPSFSGSAAEATNLANAIQQVIREADQDDLAGWVVDVRGNGGGNMWPMIAGVGPILGTGVAGYFTTANTSEPWGYRDGASWLSNSPMQTVGMPYRLRREGPRVAVLTDNAVASSGEAVVIAFRGRPDTRSFGTPTCGRSSANQGFTLSDGAMLLLTTALMADRTGTSYGGRVEPDEHVAQPDEVVERAVAWLRGR